MESFFLKTLRKIYSKNKNLNGNNIEGKILCDIPKKVISIRINSNVIICKVEWKKRYDGSIPKKSEVTFKFLKNHYPEILIEYLESNLIIFKA